MWYQLNSTGIDTIGSDEYKQLTFSDPQDLLFLAGEKEASSTKGLANHLVLCHSESVFVVWAADKFASD